MLVPVVVMLTPDVLRPPPVMLVPVVVMLTPDVLAPVLRPGGCAMVIIGWKVNHIESNANTILIISILEFI
jgi:hypothetical protein